MKDRVTLPRDAKVGDTVKIRTEYDDGVVITEYKYTTEEIDGMMISGWSVISIDASGIDKC